MLTYIITLTNNRVAIHIEKFSEKGEITMEKNTGTIINAMLDGKLICVTTNSGSTLKNLRVRSVNQYGWVSCRGDIHSFSSGHCGFYLSEVSCVTIVQ